MKSMGMKNMYVLLLCMGIYSGAAAQSRVSTVEYQKINRDAVIKEVPYPEKTVMDAIQDTLEKLGYRGRESKGFMVFKGVRLAVLGNEYYDLYFSADRKSKKEKESSVLTMMVSRGEGNFIMEVNDAAVINKVKNYLDNINHMIARYDLEQQINEQDDIVRKEEKRAAGLIEDADDLQKKKKKIEEEIADNIKEQAKQKGEVEKQKGILGTLIGKRIQ